MKNRFSKIVSSMLILAFLVSVFAVFSFAAETDGNAGTGAQDDITVVVNREYDEGWDALNGFNAAVVDFQILYRQYRFTHLQPPPDMLQRPSD